MGALAPTILGQSMTVRTHNSKVLNTPLDSVAAWVTNPSQGKKIHETLASASVHDQHRRKASLKGSIRRSRSSHSRMADGM